MIAQISFYAQRLRLASPANLLRQLGRWWLAEFVGLFPPRLAAWLTGNDRKRLVAFASDDGVRLHLQDSRGENLACVEFDGSDCSATSLDRFLAQHQLRRENLDIGIHLGTNQIFERRFLLPAAAQSALPAIVAQDLMRKMPFKLTEVHHDFDAAVTPDGKIRVVQWVARSSVVAEAISELRLEPRDVAFLTADPVTSGGLPAFLRLRQKKSNGPNWMRMAWVVLLGSCGILTVGLLGLKLWHQQLALDDLDARVAALAPKAQQVRTLVTGFERAQSVVAGLRQRKQDAPGILDLWEEATRFIPHDTWLTELRLVEATEKHAPKVVMTGFSTAAARLVGVVDASPLFSDAVLTAPISRDNLEERERFSIEATLRKRGRRGGTP